MMESEEINGRTIAIERKGTFDDYLKKNDIPAHEFNSLSRKEKEKFFLCWKVGTSDSKSAWDMQMTINQLYGELTDKDVEETKDPYEKRYMELTLDWERKCHSWAFKYGIGSCIHVKPKIEMKWEQNDNSSDIYQRGPVSYTERSEPNEQDRSQRNGIQDRQWADHLTQPG